jgi:23S rRNA maturation mini-RNase III
MATSETTRERPGDESGQVCLSGFERRCLLRRICECHEVVQRAILGAGSAQHKAAVMTHICEALQQAEKAIAKAELLAATDDQESRHD